MARKSTIEGMFELERAFRDLGKVPQSAATVSARDGGRIALRAAKANAPEDTGDLKRGIVMKKERKTIAGKSVYDVMMDPAMNDIFVKKSKDGKRAYYPASQEYGFITKDGGYVPGYHFLRRALEDNAERIEEKVLDTAKKYVDKALAKGAGRR